LHLPHHLVVKIAKRRWLKKILRPWLPSIAKYKLFDRCFFYFDPRDLTGPSFHFAYDLEKGFLNYEIEAKNELLNDLPKDGIFFDVGANIGLYSLYFALERADLNIICFEPNPLAYECLQKTFSSWKGKKPTLYQKAVGSKNEQKKLYQSHVNDGGHSLHFSPEHLDKNIDDFSLVTTIQLDEWIDQGLLPIPQALKIDVEGFELEVLKGVKKTLIKHRPILLIECSNQDLANKNEFWQFMDQFSALNIRAKIPGQSARITLEQLSQHAFIQWQEGIPLSNYFYFFGQ
jgi:FkbM family methyltransferase